MGRIYIESGITAAPKAIEVSQELPVQLPPAPKEIEVIKEIEVVRTEYIEVPVEVIKEVEVIREVEVIKEIEVIKEVERVVKVIETIEVPVEKIIRIEDMGKLEQLRNEIADYKRKNKILSIGLSALILLTMIMGAINV